MCYSLTQCWAAVRILVSEMKDLPQDTDADDEFR